MKFLINIKKIINSIKDMDNAINKAMKYGIKISFLILLIGTYFLSFYLHTGTNLLFTIGFLLFKTSIYYCLAFVGFAISFNILKKQSL